MEKRMETAIEGSGLRTLGCRLEGIYGMEERMKTTA